MGLAKREEVFDDSSDNTTPITSQQIAIASEDTFLNRTSLNPEQYPDVFAAITSYVSGSPIIVDYFKVRVPYINKQTMTASFSLERAAARSSYDRIHDMELKLQDQLEIEIDPDTNETSIKGIAVSYSGFRPNAGDLFYFKLPDDQIGVFIVNKAIPLSIYRGTNYKIEFHLYSFITQDIDTKIAASVIEDLYFDKQKYFSDEAALLSNTSYNQLQELKEFNKDILKRVFSYFYNSEEKTLMRKDRFYDPMITMFWLSILSVNDYSSSTPLCQVNSLYNRLFEGTIWKAFLNKDLNQFNRAIISTFRYQTHLWDSNYSSLDKLMLLLPRKDDEDAYDERLTIDSLIRADESTTESSSYVFSNRLYMALMKHYEQNAVITDVDPVLVEYQNDPRFVPELEDSAFAFNKDSYLALSAFTNEDILNTNSNNNIHMPDGEYMLYEWLVYNRVDTQYLLDVVKPLFPFSNMTDTDKFYYYPVFFYLTKLAIQQLR